MERELGQDDPRPVTTGTARYWCITIWNINGEPLEDVYNDPARGEGFIKEWCERAIASEERIRYFIGQLERGEGTRRIHLQCYLELGGNGGVRGTALANLLGLGRGTQNSAVNITNYALRLICSSRRAMYSYIDSDRKAKQNNGLKLKVIVFKCGDCTNR